MITRLILALVLGCANSLLAASSSGLSPVRFFERATNQFDTAHLIKPAEPKDSDIAFKLAPLIIQEALGDEPLHDRFGALNSSNGIPVLDIGKPTVYVYLDEVKISGKEHARFSYLWCYPPDPGNSSGASLTVQGVRITTDSAGAPVIWEVLADSSGMTLLFVAESLEAAARKQWNKLSPGRRFYAEAGLRQAPSIIVSRIIADGPVPMGPIMYLQRSSRNVSTVVCRCMPAQARSLLSSSFYEIKPIQTDGADVLLQMVRDRAKLRTTFWPGSKDSTPLQKRLRLPSTF